jgi:hypothetical protein
VAQPAPDPILGIWQFESANWECQTSVYAYSIICQTTGTILVTPDQASDNFSIRLSTTFRKYPSDRAPGTENPLASETTGYEQTCVGIKNGAALSIQCAADANRGAGDSFVLQQGDSPNDYVGQYVSGAQVGVRFWKVS